MHISIEADETVGIVNVYAPVQDNITEKLGFFKDLKNYLSKIKKQKLGFFTDLKNYLSKIKKTEINNFRGI